MRQRKRWGEGFFYILVLIPICILLLFSLTLSIEHNASGVVSGEVLHSVTGTIFELNLNNFFIPLGVGICVAFLVAYYRLHRLFKNRWFIYFCLGCIALVFLLSVVPNPFVETINNAKRWISVFGYTFQATEFIKIMFVGCCAFFADLFCRNKDVRFFDLCVFCVLLVGILAIGVAQSHFGFLCIIFFTLILLSPFVFKKREKRVKPKQGTKKKYIIGGLGVLVAIVVGFAISQDSRILDLFETRILGEDTYHHQRNLEAISSASIFGKGRGEVYATSILAPEKHTDSIFNFLVYEHGVLAGVLVLSFYAMLCILILLLAKRVPFFEQVFAVGIASLLFFQVFFNISFAILHPITGEVLPFLSSGGSALFVWLIIFGLVFSVYRSQ